MSHDPSLLRSSCRSWGLMVAEIVLIAWIFVGTILFGLLPPTRAFLLTYIIGLLLLPVEVDAGRVGSIYFTASLRIDKATACHLAALLGTMLFAPEVARKYRFDLFDLAFLGVTVAAFITSLVNAVGLKDGLSSTVNLLRLYGPVIVLAKMHITTMDDLYETMRCFIGGAVLYTLVAVGEFRLSPQLHRILYGYFQHGFEQFTRYQHFRPVGMFRHAIELSFFMGTSMLMALALVWKKMFPPLWGIVPGWAVVLTLLAGLGVTLTFSGYIAFLVGLGMLAAISLLRRRWLLLVLPLLAVVWMAGRYTNVIDASFLVSGISSIDPVRADSLAYRLSAEDIHLATVHQHPFWGQSGMIGLTRTVEGRLVMAVDAFWLIHIGFYGIVGLGSWLLVWSGGIVAAWRLWPHSAPSVRWIAAIISVLLGLQFIDFLFNSFPSYFLLILSVGLIRVAMGLPQVVPQPLPLPPWAARSAASLFHGTRRCPLDAPR